MPCISILEYWEKGNELLRSVNVHSFSFPILFAILSPWNFEPGAISLGEGCPCGLASSECSFPGPTFFRWIHRELLTYTGVLGTTDCQVCRSRFNRCSFVSDLCSVTTHHRPLQQKKVAGEDRKAEKRESMEGLVVMAIHSSS